VFDEMFEWVFHWLFLISYCVDLKQWSGGSQRLKVRCLGVTLRGLKDELNEFNQGVNPGDTRRVEYVRYKRPTLDEGRVSFGWVELTNDENVTSMFLEHNMFQWIDMRVTLLRSTEDIIKSLIPPKDRYYQESDFAKRSWLGREMHLPTTTIVFLWIG